MKEHAIRLTKGQDLKKVIYEYVQKNHIQAGVILSAVGCVNQIHFRKAKALAEYFDQNDYEIVSLIGTVSENGLHLHISLCDENLNTIGGHLLDSTIVNTTCELVIGELEDFIFTREYDENTGYNELVIHQKKPV